MRKQVIVKTLWGIAGLLVVGSASARADTYHRFWRGMKQANLSLAQFQDGLNQIFVPATVATGQGKGMIAYEPILTAGISGLPDEVALVSYASKDAYDALYSTDAGKQYQNLHWQYFDRALSHSVVPEPFAGNVEPEHAYDLDPGYSGWMHNTTTVRVSFRRSGENPSDFLRRSQARVRQARATDRDVGIFDRVVLISQDYLIEYVSAATALNADAEIDLVVPAQSEEPSSAQIIPRQGVNLQF